MQPTAGSSDAFITKLSSAGNTLVYSTYLGGSDIDYGYGIGVDASGNAYVTGYTYSTDFPATPGAYDESYNGGSDAFITKLSSAGNTLVYSSYLGGANDDFGYRIGVDASGNAYVTGNTTSDPFPTTAGAYDETYNGGSDIYFGSGDAFITKVSSTGTALSYSTYLGGTGVDFAYGIVVDATDNAYVAGYTTSTNFPTSNAYQGTLRGSADAFITKLSATGSALSYSTYLGGHSIDVAYAIAVDVQGNAYVTGNTDSTTTNNPTLMPFPIYPLIGALQPKYGGGGSDAFITKLSSTGSALSYSTYLGGSGEDIGSAIAVDASGRAYVAGYTTSGNFPTKDPFQATFGGWSDAFITKVSLAGSALLYSTYLGGSESDFANGIAVDPTFGYAYVTGLTYSIDFPTQNPFQPDNTNSSDAFVTKVNTIPQCSQCPGDPETTLVNKEFLTGTECECTAATSITAGPGVVIYGGAIVNFKSPFINFKPGVEIKPGAVVRTRTGSGY